MWSLELYIVFALGIILLTRFWIYYRWRNSKCRGLQLPPGSEGFPLIGETLELLIPRYTLDVHPFIKKRIQRYGPLFRTNVGGQDVIVSADPDFNHYLFQQEGKLVERSYLDLFNKVFKTEDFNVTDIHKYWRKVTLNQFGLQSIKEKLLPQLEEVVRAALHSWSLQDSVELTSASILEIFGEFGAKQLFGDIENLKELLDNFSSFSKAALSFPLDIPGTTYHKCIKEKDKALKMIGDIVKARLTSSPQNTQDDLLLSKILKDVNKVNFLSDELIPQLMFGATFVVSESIATPLAFAVKFISENPAVLRDLMAEHEEILKKRKNLDSLTSWEEYKSMTFTLQVINETLRLTNTIPGLLRKTIKDTRVKDYTIPAGWKIMICHPALHLDPKTYKDPLTFDPWRWKDVPSEFTCKNLIPFGGGIKQCAGADFARASLCIFLHVLVTKYRWSVVKGGDIIQNPVLHFKNGLHISVYSNGDVKTAQ